MVLLDQDTARLCRELAVLLHAGVNLADGMYLLAAEEQKPLKESLEGMAKQLDMGMPLSDALRDSGIFPGYAWAMVHVGEQTGRLEDALNGLGAFYEEKHRVRYQIRNAVAYPAMVMGLMLVVLGVLLIKVLPVFDQVYGSLGSQLTGAAAGLLYLGQGLEKMLPVLLAVLLSGAAGYLAVRASEDLKRRLAVFWQKRFGDRGINRKFNNARFARAMAMGLSSGMGLELSMDLARQLLQNVPGAAERCAHCAARMAEGASFREAAEEAKLLPPAQCRLLSLGIQGGNGDVVMEQIADAMMSEAQNDLNDAIARIEPAMVLISSVLVGAILLAVMLPLVDILSILG